LAQHVNETRCDHLVPRIDFTLCSRVAQIANAGNAIALDCYIRTESATAGAIDNTAIPNNDVVFFSCSIRRPMGKNERTGDRYQKEDGSD
jgi:hypothetical protein